MLHAAWAEWPLTLCSQVTVQHSLPGWQDFPAWASLDQVFFPGCAWDTLSTLAEDELLGCGA